jgi:hypothetical protein
MKKVRDIIDKKDLEVELVWIPREKNLAGRMLDRRHS